MKLFVRALCSFATMACLLSCSNAHFLKEKSYRDQVARDFKQRLELFPSREAFSIFLNDSLSQRERETLMFLYAYMPLCDIGDYPGEFHLENIRLAEQARAEMPWGATVPEELFRHFVLPVRVNNENLDHSRKVFYEALKDRVKSLSMADAILEVNHWCHEKVTYQPSDPRTSAPLATLRTAYGRCGEESTFTVAALRAVGIPARQIYTPRWAHTDDNHAWVEAWADGQWHFVGACEPEPVLDLGWFNAPASRGMLMHTKVFGRYQGPEEVIAQMPDYTEINVTCHYADTAKATVTVVDEQNRPVPNACVEFKIYNYAEFYTAAAKQTDERGQASLTAGRGDMLVWASAGERFGFAKLSFGQQASLTVKLDKKAGDLLAVDLDIVPPAENARLPEVLPELRAQNNRRLAEEDSLRNAYVATFPAGAALDSIFADVRHLARVSPQEWERLVPPVVKKSRGNYKAICSFIKSGISLNRFYKAMALLGTLTEKDLRDADGSALIDHLVNTPNLPEAVYKQSLEASPDRQPAEVRYVLNPRVSTEMLVSYRAFLQSKFTGDEKKDFRNNPQKIAEWIDLNFQVDSLGNAAGAPLTPKGVWTTRRADILSRNIFFVALARSMNIPACIRETDGQTGYWDSTGDEARFVPVTFGKEQTAAPLQSTFRLCHDGKPLPAHDRRTEYYSRYTLSKISGGKARLLNSDFGEFTNQGTLDEGYYLLVTGTRLANGGVLARLSTFTVPGAEPVPEQPGIYNMPMQPVREVMVDYRLRESGENVAVIGSFNSESRYTPVSQPGTEAALLSPQSLLQTCGRGYFVVGVIQPGQEPTNHALRDIAALKGELEEWGRNIVLLFPDEAQCRKFNPADYPALPATVRFGIDTEGICQQIADNMQLKHAHNLPLFIIADTFNRVVFVKQGYTIGLGEQLLKVVRGL